MTSRETLLAVAVGLAAVTALRRAHRAATRRAGRARSPRLAGSARRRDRAGGRRARRPGGARRVGDWVVVDAAGGLLVGVIGVVGLASALASPAYPRHHDVGPVRFRARGHGLLRGAVRVLGGAARGAARREPRRRLAARRGDDRGVGAARRLQRQAARARGGLEVPDPDVARTRRRAARDRAARGRRRPAAGSTRSSWRALATVRRRPARRRSSRTCCCSPDSRPRSAGRRCTTGCPTRTPRRRHRSRRCSRPRCCRPCCSSPGASSRRSRPSSARDTAEAVLIGFGLVSLAVAVPFLWRPLPWKRLLAYSSLEHMGVIALGIGFATPLALAGVAVHIVGHAVAKALGFYAATPLLGHEPRAAGHAVTGIARTQPGARRDARHLARRARRPAAVAAVRQRGADRRGRLPGRPPLGRGGDRGPARARLPRARPRAASRRLEAAHAAATGKSRRCAASSRLDERVGEPTKPKRVTVAAAWAWKPRDQRGSRSGRRQAGERAERDSHRRPEPRVASARSP